MLQKISFSFVFLLFVASLLSGTSQGSTALTLDLNKSILEIAHNDREPPADF